MKISHIICHYAEIGLKGKNRIFFEKKLKSNIKYSLTTICPNCIETIRLLRGRILITLTNIGSQNIDSLISVLKNVFGIAYFAPATEIEMDIELIKKAAVQMLSETSFKTFRVTGRRSYSNFPYTGQQLNEEVGAFIVERMGKKVNLSSPDKTCYIDILQKGAFIYSEKISGPGGLPVGSSGKVVVMLSGGIDSPVAAFYALKRGAKPVYVHFHSVPHVSPASIEKVRDTILSLTKFYPNAKLILIKFAPIQDEILLKSNSKFRVILYRRFMVRIANVIARNENAFALFTGEALGQVASQTMINMAAVEAVTNMPIMRPLIGFDKQDIINIAKKIDTYDISIRPYQDCCTLYIPKHPVTKARIKDVEKEETELNVDLLVQEAVNDAEIEYVGN